MGTIWDKTTVGLETDNVNAMKASGDESSIDRSSSDQRGTLLPKRYRDMLPQAQFPHWPRAILHVWGSCGTPSNVFMFRSESLG